MATKRDLPRARPRWRRVDGVLLLDKPCGISSNAALQRARRALTAEKAGHTGTLDPAASGLLPLCFGEATKFAGWLLDAPKAYRATIRFGASTTTGDAEGEVVAQGPVAFDREALAAALLRFTGTFLQVPPRHSALKHAGRAHYEYARAGIEVPRAPREVTVDALDLVSWQPPDAVVDVRCSKGTYVRSLAEDLGVALGTVAHLAGLRRTSTGGFGLESAVALDALEAMAPEDRERCLLPPSVLVAALPRIEVDAEKAGRFRQGMALAVDVAGEGAHAVFAAGGLLGIADVAAGVVQPRRVVRGPAEDPGSLDP